MTEYIILAVIIALLCLIHNRKWTVVVAATLLVIIAGFRAESVGTDTINYYKLFEWYGDNLFGGFHANEPGYAMLQLLVVRAGGSFHTLVFLVQLLIITGLSLFARKVAHHPQYVLLCYLLLYFYFYSFNTARQFLAIPLLLFAYHNLDIGKTKPAIVLIIVGTMFHYTAIIGMLILLFRKRRWSVKLQVTLLIVTFLVGLTSFVQIIAANMLSFLPPALFNYILSVEDYRGIDFSLSRFLLTGFTILLILTLRNTSNRLSILTLGICILNLFAFHPVVARAAQYFTIIQIVIIPEIAYMIRPKYRKGCRLLEVGAILYMIIVFAYLLSANTAGVVPYSFGSIGII